MTKKKKKHILLPLICCMLLSTANTSSLQAAAKIKTTKKLTLEKGTSKKIKVSGAGIRSVKYRSDHKKIATVNKKGKVTGRKKGTCKIKILISYKKTKTSTKKQVTQVCKVTVKQNKLEQTTLPIETPTAFVSQYADFALHLWKNSSLESIKTGKNSLLSPDSVINALSMTMNGAAGNTLTEMQNVLCGSQALTDYNSSLQQWNQHLTNNQNVTFHMANGIWVKETQDAVLKQSFQDVNKDFYNAKIQTAPFNEVTLNEINDFVKENTHQMIDKILDHFSTDTIACLVNALAFEGKWSKQYSNNQVLKEQSFTNALQKEESATMLQSSENIYLEDSMVSGFIKSYEGEQFGFMALLPKEGISATDYINQLTGEQWLNIYGKRQSAQVDAKIPEFCYDDSLSLTTALSSMGIHDAFQDSAANFTNMFDLAPEKNIYISDVFHKTHIELDQYGTKAAAATSVTMNLASCAPNIKIYKVYLNRPFVYGIIDIKTGLPIFIGMVNTLQ